HSDATIVDDSQRRTRDEGDTARRMQVERLCKMLDAKGLPADSSQAIVVTSDRWDSRTGTMWLCQRKNGHWSPTENHWAVNVGTSGMAWGDGKLQKIQSNKKHEGDGKA